MNNRVIITFLFITGFAISTSIYTMEEGIRLGIKLAEKLQCPPKKNEQP
jgi:hypothetical protein